MAQDQRATQKFIVKVLAEKPNPFAYYPFNRDLFLPTSDDKDLSNLDAGPSIVVLDDRDSTYANKTFVDAFGAPIKIIAPVKRKRFSSKTDESFFYRKQQYHLNQYPNMGRFLYFFSSRK